LTEKQTPNWADWFYYDPTSPSGLRWKVDRAWGSRLVAIAGEPAGRKMYKQSGAPAAWMARLHGKIYSVHRIILSLNGITIQPTNVVDHIDGNPFNNTIENLRVVRQSVNTRNRKKPATNSSGTVGIRRVAEHTQSPRWKAVWITLSGRRGCKSFSVSRYGEELAKALAIKAREDAIKALNGSGAGYSERHGT